MSKEYPTCCDCGSKDVLKDAFAEWDYDTQEWVLHSTFDDMYCENCEGSTKEEWVEEANDITTPPNCS